MADDEEAQMREERLARSGDARLGAQVSMDLDLYGGDAPAFDTLEDEDDAAAPSSAAAGYAASLAQRVIASHGLEAEADGEAALRSFREAGGTASTATVGSRENEVRFPLFLRLAPRALPPNPSFTPLPSHPFPPLQI